MRLYRQQIIFQHRHKVMLLWINCYVLFQIKRIWGHGNYKTKKMEYFNVWKRVVFRQTHEAPKEGYNGQTIVYRFAKHSGYIPASISTFLVKELSNVPIVQADLEKNEDQHGCRRKMVIIIIRVKFNTSNATLTHPMSWTSRNNAKNTRQ